jgi:uncharacterized membrane-anchored protein
MRMGAVMSRVTGDRRDLPGVTGTARVDRDTDALLRRVRAGDVVILDEVDLDRPTAEALIFADVAAVVNVSPSISGRYPTLGPAGLLANGIMLVDRVQPEILKAVRDGARVRVHDGGVFVGERLLGRGTPQTPAMIAEAMDLAREALTIQLEAFSANTIEFMHQDRDLLLDGVGVPDVRVRLDNRPVLVVAAGTDHVEDLARLRRYIRDYRPVLVGVGAGADALCAAGYRPDLVVGDPADISDRALTSGADVVVPAFADGHAPGLNRVQDLGAGAVTFPATGNPEDLALLLAHHHGASLIITVGYQATLGEFLDRGRSGRNASTFLTRLKVGGVLVDGKAAAALHTPPVSAGAVSLLFVAALVVATVAVAVTPVGPALWGYLERLYDMLAQLVTGWLAR